MAHDVVRMSPPLPSSYERCQRQPVLLLRDQQLATAKVTKAAGSGGGGDTAPRAAGDDPWRRSLSPEDPWASAAPGQPDEPPY
jgi:hypothetical protein